MYAYRSRFADGVNWEATNAEVCDVRVRGHAYVGSIMETQ